MFLIVTEDSQMTHGHSYSPGIRHRIFLLRLSPIYFLFIFFFVISDHMHPQVLPYLPYPPNCVSSLLSPSSATYTDLDERLTYYS